MAKSADGSSAVYLQVTNPALTVGTPVNPGDFWYDNTNLWFRTTLNTWLKVV